VALLRILLVDDDEAVAFLMGRLLKKAGHLTATRRDATAALALLQADPQGIDVVVTDQNMPGMSGIELAVEIAKRYPRLPVVLLSGLPVEQIREMAQGSAIATIVDKADAMTKLVPAIQQVMRADSGRPAAPT
jgi:DNA-binding NtrC family response regulator